MIAVPAFAADGYDAASVSDDRIPWSGYWWPDDLGELVLGYSNEPSPLEKYEAYINGYSPADIYPKILEEHYNPDAYPWYGHCHNWAAASVLSPEPKNEGDLMGIPFRVGDKKGLLTLFYDGNVTSTYYGVRYEDEESDPNDIYPGGVEGFHQILINYIRHQNLPVIVEVSPGPQVWNHPAFKYEMEWVDEGLTRLVTCTVWYVDDMVSPDYVGSETFSLTYTYRLILDEFGNPADEKGEWVGESIDRHPDFMWFPVLKGNESLLDEDAVTRIVECESTGSDDRFEENDAPDQSFSIPEMVKGRNYFGAALDADWYAVPLGVGEDFTLKASGVNPDEITLLDPLGKPAGVPISDGIYLENILQSGIYKIHIPPSSKDFYRVQFYQSPVTGIPHIACGGGWDTEITVFNPKTDTIPLRFNLFDTAGNLIASKEQSVSPSATKTLLPKKLFGMENITGGRIRIISPGGDAAPAGQYSYHHKGARAQLPLQTKTGTSYILPHIAATGAWWTGLSIENANPVRNADIQVSAYSSEGALVNEKTLSISSGGSWTGYVEEIWGSAVPEAHAWMKFTSSQPIRASAIWETSENPENPGIAGISLPGPDNRDAILYIPHVETQNGWWLGVSLVNDNPLAARIQLRGYDSSGSPTEWVFHTILQMGSITGYIQELFQEKWAETIRWAEIRSDRPLSGFMVYGLDGVHLAAFPLPGNQSGIKEFSIIDIPENTGGWAGLVMLNPTAVKADVYADAFDAEGNRLMEEGKHLWYNSPDGLPPFASGVAFVRDFFPGIPENTQSLKVFSESPVFGFGLYGNEEESTLSSRVYFHE